MPLVPSPINRVPRGLLDFLGIRAGGRNPQTMPEQLLPVMELSEWYKTPLETRCLFGSLGFAATTAGPGYVQIPVTVPATTANCLVPQNEFWILRRGSHIVHQWSAHAGSEGRYSIAVINATSLVIRVPPQTHFDFRDSSAALTRGGQTVLNEEFWIHPGEEIRVMNHGTTIGAGGSVAISGSLTIVRLRL